MPVPVDERSDQRQPVAAIVGARGRDDGDEDVARDAPAHRLFDALRRRRREGVDLELAGDARDADRERRRDRHRVARRRDPLPAGDAEADAALDVRAPASRAAPGAPPRRRRRRPPARPRRSCLDSRNCAVRDDGWFGMPSSAQRRVVVLPAEHVERLPREDVDDRIAQRQVGVADPGRRAVVVRVLRDAGRSGRARRDVRNRTAGCRRSRTWNTADGVTLPMAGESSRNPMRVFRIPNCVRPSVPS